VKIFAFSDLHDEEDAFAKLKQAYGKSSFDCTFILGDTTNHSFSFLEKVVSSFKNCFFIPGNNEDPGLLEHASKLKGYLHAKSTKIGRYDYDVVGFGYSPPTPFGTPGEMSDDDIGKQMGALDIGRNTILLTHAPPYRTFDETKFGYAGSTAIATILAQKKPFALFCGHIHERSGVKRVGETWVVKVPAAKDYHYCTAEIKDKSITAEFPEL
jgi:Icc-related predicted phosphoesterase